MKYQSPFITLIFITAACLTSSQYSEDENGKVRDLTQHKQVESLPEWIHDIQHTRRTYDSRALGYVNSIPLQPWQVQARARDGNYRLDPFALVEDAKSKAQQIVESHATRTRRGPRLGMKEEFEDSDFHYLRPDSRSAD